MNNPKSLEEALSQAAEYINKISAEAGISHRITSADKMIFEKFVKEFLAEVFSDHKSKESEQLWKRITS